MSTTSERVSFNIPTREEVSESSKAVFDQMKNLFGKVPNIYAVFALNETALSDYFTLQNRKNTLSAKEREIINLVVSQVNQCNYCLPAHTAVGRMVGFTDDQMMEIRRAQITFDNKFDALAKFVYETAMHRGRPSEHAYSNFFKAGYTKANLIDVMIIIGDKVISNYLHNVTQFRVDWPEVPKI